MQNNGINSFQVYQNKDLSRFKALPNYFAGAGLFVLLLFIDGFFDGIQLLDAFVCNLINVIDIRILIGATFASHFRIIADFHRTCYYAQCYEW